jgi:hypothetical protein
MPFFGCSRSADHFVAVINMPLPALALPSFDQVSRRYSSLLPSAFVRDDNRHLIVAIRLDKFVRLQSYKKFSFRVRHLSATHEIFAIQCNKQIPCHKHFIASLIASYCILLHHFNLDGGTKKEQ